jgi:hypothetical protein
MFFISKFYPIVSYIWAAQQRRPTTMMGRALLPQRPNSKVKPFR